MQWLFAAELISLMIIFFVKSGESLHCYVCRSDEHKGCAGSGEPMNKSLSVECPAKPGRSQVYCRKIHQTLSFKNDEVTKIRECAYEKGKKDCYVYKVKDVVRQKICECDKDLCNRGTSLKSSNLRIFVTCCAWILSYLTI